MLSEYPSRVAHRLLRILDTDGDMKVWRAQAYTPADIYIYIYMYIYIYGDMKVWMAQAHTVHASSYVHASNALSATTHVHYAWCRSGGQSG